MDFSKKDRIFQNLNGELTNYLTPTLKQALSFGDFDNTKSLMTSNIIEIIKDSNLRGRGGAGFSTGIKWSFMPKTTPSYFIVNADESEPGTCKDRAIITFEPYKIIEGALLASFAINANKAFVYIRGEYYKESKILQEAIDQAYAAKLLGQNNIFGFPFDITLHRGAGAYICGEETALIESLEGKKGFPRLKPPFPAQFGLYGKPTTVNNVETVAVIPTILRRGSDWFKSFGTKTSSGTKIFSVCGNVKTPCIVELPLGTNMMHIIDKYAGGVNGSLKAVIPGGSSTQVIPNNLCLDASMDFESLHSIGSSLGTGGMIVMNEKVNIVKAIYNLARFYENESCGQCSPCREGTYWISKILKSFIDGTALKQDISLLEDLTNRIKGTTICALADAAIFPIEGLLKHFKSELEDLLF